MASCKSPQMLVYKQLISSTVEKRQSNKTNARLKLLFYNPNAFGLRVKNVDALLYINQKPFGKVQLDTALSVKKSALFELPLSVEVDDALLLQHAMFFIVSKKVVVNVIGKASVRKWPITTKRSFSFEQEVFTKDLLQIK
jgi:LEA14-like dessication related protein